MPGGNGGNPENGGGGGGGAPGKGKFDGATDWAGGAETEDSARGKDCGGAAAGASGSAFTISGVSARFISSSSCFTKESISCSDTALETAGGGFVSILISGLISGAGAGAGTTGASDTFAVQHHMYKLITHNAIRKLQYP